MCERECVCAHESVHVFISKQRKYCKEHDESMVLLFGGKTSTMSPSGCCICQRGAERKL